MAIYHEQLVTPEQAQLWLDQSPHNFRSLNARSVKQFVALMKNNQWVFTAEPLIFDTSGYLMEGQHRLTAVIESGVPILFACVSGVPRASVRGMNTGRSRNFADYLRSQGETNVSALAGATHAGWRFENRLVRAVYAGETPSVAVADEWLQSHPEIRPASIEAEKVRRVLPVPAAPLAAVIYAAHQVADADEVEYFVDRLKAGTYLRANDPILQLRNRIIKDDSLKQKLPTPERAALIIKAWNAYVHGQEISRLVWRSSGPRAEAFPLVEGPEGEVWPVGSPENRG
jgi:hypothetical protein